MKCRPAALKRRPPSALLPNNFNIVRNRFASKRLLAIYPSLRSLWSARERTCTSKIAPMLGAYDKGRLVAEAAFSDECVSEQSSPPTRSHYGYVPRHEDGRYFAIIVVPSPGRPHLQPSIVLPPSVAPATATGPTGF